MEAIARFTVQTSIVAAAAVGCWLLWLGGQPSACVIGAIVFFASAVGARWRFVLIGGVVLFLAYTAAGPLLLVRPPMPPWPLWLAAFAGLVAGGVSWTRWTAPAEWRWPLMLWLLGIAISWPIIAAREADFASVVRGDGVGPIVLAALATLCTGLWLDTALAWDLETIERRVARPLLAGAIVAALAVFYQAFIDITWLSGPPWIALARAPGLLADPNPMAVAAALWALLSLLLFGRRLHYTVGAACALLLAYAAWLTGARSVILLLGAGVAGLVGGAIAQRTTTRRAVLVALSAAFVAVVVAIVLSRAGASGPIARLTSTLPLDHPGALAYEVLLRRDGYGVAAARAIREQPWSGVGHGAFNFLAPYYYRLEGGPPIPQDNAQNLWRHALAERGLLAFAAVVAMTIATVRMLLTRPSAVSPFYSWSLKATVLGLGLVLVFGLPIQNPAIALTAASLLAWLHAATRRSKTAIINLDHRLVIAIWVLALAGAGVDAWNARGDLRPPWRAARVGDPYVYGFGENEVGPDGITRGRAITDHAVVALRVSGPRFRLRYWARGAFPQRVQAWLDQRLVIDEAVPSGTIVEHLLDVPAGHRGMLLELETHAPGVVVAGEFVSR